MNKTTKPDLSNGVIIDQLSDGGMLLGQIDGEDAILTRSGNEFFAVGATAPIITGYSRTVW